ncbi:MAG: hypothetical protein HOO94_05170 [Novosphingobium sp.]|uniref:hypothetical protein n=1 Tax=Novosphingobium sp. TaxID=1874826 RepID=UPI001803A4AB|nr:hypothetical protein [Novosphingobium sp.]
MKPVDENVESIPDLDPTTLKDPQTVSVRYDLVVNDGQINLVMVDTTPWPECSSDRAVSMDPDGNYALVVERGQDRIFEFELSPDVDWSFDPDMAPGNSPMTIKRGPPALYKAELIGPRLLSISAKSRPDPPKGGAEDHFNLYIKLGQAAGLPISVRIDPGAENPPGGG